MAKLWTTGPAYIYVQPYTLPLYLGTAKIKPAIEIVPEWSNFYSDEIGRKTPADQSIDMEHAWIYAEMNRFSETAYEACVSAQRTSSQSGQAPASALGVYSYRKTGTMIIAEDLGIELWVQFPYSKLNAFQGMPQGYHFPTTVFYGPDKFTDLGSSERSIMMAWHALPDVDPGLDQFVLYDTEGFSGLPAPDDTNPDT